MDMFSWSLHIESQPESALWCVVKLVAIGGSKKFCRRIPDRMCIWFFRTN
jgi:hypothetical protein